MTTWIKVYNTMPQHPKLLVAGDRAAWLQICGLCYANEHLTDGFIPRHALPVVAPGVKGAEALARRLSDAGLWHEEKDGWRIHDYAGHQRSAEEIRERRARDAARKAARRSAGSPHGQGESVRAESASLDVDVDVDVDREEAKASSSGAERADQEMSKASDEDRANCRLFSELLLTVNPKAKIPKARTAGQANWIRDTRLLRQGDGNTAAEIGHVIRWLFTDPHRDAVFWRTTIKAPSGLREHYAQIHAKMLAAGNGHANGKPPVESSDAYLARRGIS